MESNSPHGAPDAVQSACRATVDGLARDERLMPSVYLERGGRLRCEGAHGYRQVLDGMLPSTGVIGKTFSSGRPQAIGDIGDAPEYLAAALDVVSEVCLPLRHDGRVIGVVNVESRSLIDDDQVVAIEAAAAELEHRIAEIGGVPRENAAQRLARAAAHLASLSDEGEIATAALEAACDLTGMDSALLVGGRRRPKAQCAAGPLADVLLAAPVPGLVSISSMIERGSSFHTVAAWGREFEGLSALFGLGVKAVAAVRVPRRAHRHGVLIVADSEREVVGTGQVELLELLAALAGSALQTAADLAELRRRATTDSLTGLGHHASFNERLAAERASTERVAVLLIDVDGFKTINDTAGHQAGDRTLRAVASRLSRALRRRDEVFRIGGDEFAAIVRVTDEAEAIRIGNRLRDAAASAGITVSVGVALPAEGEADSAVLTRADRALYAVKSAGRDGVAVAG